MMNSIPTPALTNSLRVVALWCTSSLVRSWSAPCQALVLYGHPLGQASQHQLHTVETPNAKFLKVTSPGPCWALAQDPPTTFMHSCFSLASWAVTFSSRRRATLLPSMHEAVIPRSLSNYLALTNPLLFLLLARGNGGSDMELANQSSMDWVRHDGCNWPHNFYDSGFRG
jgi:hypothetical protein